MRGAGRGGAVRRRQAERVALVGVVVALWVPVACGGGGTSDVEDAEVSDGALPGEVCALLGRLEEREEELEGPEVFALDEPELAEVLAERREVLVALAGETGSELGSVLEEWVAAQPAVDEAMLATWNEDRARLAGEHNDVWLDEVVGHDVRRDDGEAIDVPDYWRNVQTGHERLVVGCRAPELADGPEQDTSEDPPPGRLAFYRPPGRAAADDGQIVVTTERGANPQALELSEVPRTNDGPRDWVPSGSLEPSPTGNHLLLNARAGDEYAMVEASLDGTIVDFVQRSTEGAIMCPGWDTRGERVLALYDSRHADERHVLLLDTTRATPSGPAPLPFATASCSDFITDDQIVVSDAALDIDDQRAVWTVGVDGSNPQELYRPTADDCATQVGSVDPAGTRVALAQTCDDPLSSGIVVVDLTSGESQRVATGTAALPKWSPDGEWLVFGFAPIGEGPRLGTWIARPDGRQLRQVVESPAWFPVWLPPA